MLKKFKSVAVKTAVVASSAFASGVALAQTAGPNDAAIQAAVDGGVSSVTLVVAGLIAIAAVVLGIGIILRLMNK